METLFGKNEVIWNWRWRYYEEILEVGKLFFFLIRGIFRKNYSDFLEKIWAILKKNDWFLRKKSNNFKKCKVWVIFRKSSNN